MPAVVAPRAGLKVAPEPLYTTRQLDHVQTLEEVLLRRKLHAEHEAKVPMWLRKTQRQPEAHPGSHLPPEHVAVETFRAASSRLGSRAASSRKRSRGGHPNQHSSHSTKEFGNKHPISAPLPYLRPLTGASPPASREGHHAAPPGLLSSTAATVTAMFETSSSAIFADAAHDTARMRSGTARGGTRTLNSGEAVVTQQLAQKCLELMDRLQVVEAELRDVQQSREQQHERSRPVSQAAGARPKSQAKRKQVVIAPGAEAAERQKQALYASVDLSIKDVADQLDSLGDVFRDGDTLESRKRWAIGKLMFFIRAIFKRRRQLRYKNALNYWRRTHAHEFIQVLTSEVERHKVICERTSFMAARRSIRLLRDLTAEWKRLTKLHLPRKLRLLQCVENMLVERKRKLLQTCSHAWWRVSVGPESGRGVRKKHKERKMMSRQKLMAQITDHASAGVLTMDMVEKETRKLVMEEVARRCERSILQRYFSVLQRLCDNRRIMMKRACYVDRVKTLKIYFFPWRQWAYLNAQGIAKKKWVGPGRYEIRYNQLQIDHMARRRLLRYSLQAWRRVISIYREAHRRFRRKVTLLVRNHFLALRALAKHNMELRRKAVKAWTEYGRDHYEVPFKLWFLFTEKRRREREARHTLVRSFRRIRIRKLLFKIMRYWRHQALYGRTGALYTRFELIRSLGMQKDHTRTMLDEMQKQELSVNDMLHMLEEQAQLIQRYEEEAKKRDEEAMSLSMAVNHAEQEVVRMQSLVECVNTIYPTAALHILKLQPGFNFRQRGLTPVAQFRLEQGRKESASAQRINGSLSSTMDGRRTFRQANGSLPSSASTPSSGSSSGSGAERRSSRSEDGQAAAQQQQQQQQPPAASQLLLPERIKWALSVTDFRPLLEAGPLSASSTTDLQGLDESSNGGEQGGNGEGPGELLSATRLYGVFEFMRTGDESALSDVDRVRWRQHKASIKEGGQGKGEQGAGGAGAMMALNDEMSRLTLGSSMLLHDITEEDGSSVADLSSTLASDAVLSEGNTMRGKTAAAGSTTSDWPGLTSEAPNATKRTWADFMVFLTARIPPKRKTEKTEERVYQRIAASKEHAEHILTSTYEGRNPAREIDVYSEQPPPPVLPIQPKLLDFNPPEINREWGQMEADEENSTYFPFKVPDTPPDRRSSMESFEETDSREPGDDDASAFSGSEMSEGPRAYEDDT